MTKLKVNYVKNQKEYNLMLTFHYLEDYLFSGLAFAKLRYAFSYKSSKVSKDTLLNNQYL